jgi:hypothetical protein
MIEEAAAAVEVAAISGVVIGIILLHLFTFASLVSSDELQFGKLF